MIEILLKYDNMHIIRVINALNCINNHIIICINSMLSLIMLPCVLFMFIEIKFIHCHFSVRFLMKSISI